MTPLAEAIRNARAERAKKSTVPDPPAEVIAVDEPSQVEPSSSPAATPVVNAPSQATPIAEEAQTAAPPIEIAAKVEEAPAAVTVPSEPPKPKSLADFLRSNVGAPVSIVPGASPLSVGAAIPGSGALSGILYSDRPLASGLSATPAPSMPSISSYRPQGITLFNTRELTSGYLHALLYGETDARKSTTAAMFGTPETTRIILVRRPEQLIPLRDLGYEVAAIENSEGLKFALLYPESLWPDWTAEKIKDRVLVLDDFTRAKDMLLEGNETRTDERGNTKEVRDARQVHKAAKDDLYDVMQVVLKRPMHFIGTALAQIYDNKITHEETVSPDIPPSMVRMLTTEFEFVFFVDKRTWKFVTTHKMERFTETDPNGKKITQERSFFGKHKLPIELEGKGVILDDEVMDLRLIWERVKRGKR